MSLRAQLYLYLILMHGFPLAMAVYFFRQGSLPGFFLMEAMLLATIPLGVLLVRKALRPVELIQASKATFQEHEFGNRLKPPGVKELDEIVGLFNEMLEELHQEQLKLGEQRGFFDRLLQATPIGIVIHDFDGLVSNANPAAEQMLELDGRAMKGRALSDCASALARTIAEQQAQLPALLTMPDGRRFRVQQSSFYDRGFQRRFLMLEELTLEMQAAERSAYEKLIHMTGHEVNNTIGATNSLLEGCRDYASQLGDEDREDFTRALNVAVERNTRLTEFMKRLSQVVRLPAPDCQPTDLRLLLDNIRAMFSAELKKRDIEWRAECGHVPLVDLDQHLFEQVLINVVKNAVEAIGSGGRITARVNSENGSVVLEVEDSAGALSQADRQKLFKPFYTTKRSGQGIGLMLVREILNQHGFSYSLDCEPEAWTRFRIHINTPVD